MNLQLLKSMVEEIIRHLEKHKNLNEEKETVNWIKEIFPAPGNLRPAC